MPVQKLSRGRINVVFWGKQRSLYFWSTVEEVKQSESSEGDERRKDGRGRAEL